MKTFKEIRQISEGVNVGDSVTIHYKKMNGDNVEKGTHTVTKVGKHDFEVDRPDSITGQNMKFKHNGYGKDYTKAGSGKIKGLSKTYGHYIKSLTDS